MIEEEKKASQIIVIDWYNISFNISMYILIYNCQIILKNNMSWVCHIYILNILKLKIVIHIKAISKFKFIKIYK